jgi:hypothetical protein
MVSNNLNVDLFAFGVAGVWPNTVIFNPKYELISE